MKNKEEKKENPPLDLKEMIESAAEKKETKADTLIMLAHNATFFKNGDEPFAKIPVGEHTEIRPLSGRHFSWWLSRQYWNKTKKPLDSETLNSILNILQARAIFDGEEYKLNNRVAWHVGAIWYDLSNTEWEAVRITQEGWEIAKPPILFRRYQHQEPQAKPIKDGDIERFLDFVNVKNDDDKLLVLVHLVSCFVPDIPHTILVPYGSQGAGKSGLLVAGKKIIDPSKMSLLSFPKDRTELVQQLDHHWFAPYDNVDHISSLISDELCKGVTGAGNSKRALYTNDEDVISVYRRCIAMNGITCAAVKPDILDRCLLIEMEHIKPRNRRKEKELWSAFEDAKPVILGGVLNVLATAMKIKPGVKLSMLPRMADFAEWGYAIAEAMGNRGQNFLDAYYANIEAQNREALTSNPVGEAIMKFMEDRPQWEGTPSELLNELEMIAEELKLGTKSKSWPKASNSLSNKLNVLKVNLLEEGVLFERSKSGNRKVTLRKVEKGEEPEGTEKIVQTVLSSKPESVNTKNLDDATDDPEIPPSGSSTISSKKKKERGEDVGRSDDKDDISLTLGKEICEHCQMPLHNGTQIEQGPPGMGKVHTACQKKYISKIRILNAIPSNNTTTVEKIQAETGLPAEYITAAVIQLKNDGEIIETREGVYRRIP